MMTTLDSTIRHRILQKLADPAWDFVFPSQVAADTQAFALCRDGCVGALDPARFMGWDRFRLRSLAGATGQKAATPIHRKLWAAGILGRQSVKPFIQSLLGPGEPSPRFLGYLARLAPRLDAGLRVQQRMQTAGDAGRMVLEDLQRLYDEYSRFLSANELVEAAWRPRTPKAPCGRRALVFAPELIEGYDPGEAGRFGFDMETIGIAALDGKDPLPSGSILAFPNAREQLRWIFGHTARLLDGGESPDDILIISTDTEQAVPLILRTAGEWGIPCRMGSGTALATSVYGRLLAAAASVGERDADFTSVRDLLLDQGIPWKRSDLNRALVRFAQEKHIQRGYGSGSSRVDIWRTTFRTCPSAPGLEEHWKSISSALAAIAQAKNFVTLRARFMEFRRTCLAEGSGSGGDGSQERELQRIVDEMNALCTLDSLDIQWPARPSRLAFLVEHLGECRYIEQGTGSAVRVYGYRVGALAAARHRFIAGCSEEATRIHFDEAVILPEFLRSTTRESQHDASEVFLRAHLLATGSLGCYAQEDFGGWSSPPGGAGAVVEPKDRFELRDEDPVLGETTAWKNALPLPEKLTAWQVEAVLGTTEASTSVSTHPATSDRILHPGWPAPQGQPALPGFPSLLAKPHPGYATDLAGDAALAAVLQARSDTSGYLRLSESALREYALCPFSWLVSRVLGLKEQKSATTFFDALLAGEMAHDLVRRLYEKIAADGRYDPEKADSYQQMLPALTSEVLAAFARREGPFLAPMAEAYLPRLLHRVGRLIESESKFKGWYPGIFEVAATKGYPEAMVTLEGRADRLAYLDDAAPTSDSKSNKAFQDIELSEDLPEDEVPEGSAGDALLPPGPFALIDYKKKKVPSKTGLYLAPQSRNPSAVATIQEADAGGDGSRRPWRLPERQIAAYIRLFERPGTRLRIASFYSIEKASWLDVIGPGTQAEREDYEAELEAFDEDLCRAAREIRAGDFRIAPPPGKSGTEHCTSCPWRRLCRSRYATE